MPERRSVTKRLAKRIAKRWLQRAVTPAVRLAVRHTSRERLRTKLWGMVVEPYFRHADLDFVSSTVFGAKMAGNTRDFIQRHIYYLGIWEPQLTSFLCSRLHEGDVFVDVGANIGYFTLLASTLVGRTGEVHAIEASPTTFASLVANLRRNRASNVYPIQAAASDGVGTVHVFRAEASNIGATSILLSEGREFEADVHADRLDHLLPEALLRRVRFVKIDVEGAEWLVVSGMRHLLSEGAETLEVLVEIQPKALRQQGRSPDEVVAFFAEFGFHAYTIDNDYSVTSYLRASAPQRPTRLHAPITSPTDVIFSKTDARSL